MEKTTSTKHDSTLIAADENVISSQAGAQPNETEQQLRRRIIQLMAELSLQLSHHEFLGLADYVASVSALTRATAAK